MKTCFKNWRKKTLKNYSEDLEISTISMIKKGLFPSLALKTAPLRGRKMQAASLHLIPKTNKTAVQDTQWSSYVFFTCWIQCQLVGYNVNLLDVVMSNPWRISMMALGTLGPSSRENPTYPNIKWRISMGFQVTRVVCTFPMKNMITSWLHVEVQIFDFFFFVYS